MKIVLVHGFNVSDGGKNTVDKLALHLEAMGHTVDKDTADYGLHNLIMVRFFYRKAVKRIANAIENADAVITHSNGANYTMKAMRKVRSMAQVVHLSPALNSKVKVPSSISRMFVFRTRNDSAVKWARWLFNHPWGAMGARGYRGKDMRVFNYDYTNRVKGHSDWFIEANAKFFAGRVMDALERKES